MCNIQWSWAKSNISQQQKTSQRIWAFFEEMDRAERLTPSFSTPLNEKQDWLAPVQYRRQAPKETFVWHENSGNGRRMGKWYLLKWIPSSRFFKPNNLCRAKKGSSFQNSTDSHIQNRPKSLCLSSPAGLLISSGTNGFRSFLSSKLRFKNFPWNLPLNFTNFTWKCIATLSAEYHRTVTTHLLRKAVLSDIKTSRHPTDFDMATEVQNFEPRMPQGIFDWHTLHRILGIFFVHGSMLGMPSKTKWISQRSNS